MRKSSRPTLQYFDTQKPLNEIGNTRESSSTFKFSPSLVECKLKYMPCYASFVSPGSILSLLSFCLRENLLGFRLLQSGNELFITNIPEPHAEHDQRSASAYSQESSFLDICARPVNGKYSSCFR